jgi:tetratricopeptide (TPR) repeat protein
LSSRLLAGTSLGMLLFTNQLNGRLTAIVPGLFLFLLTGESLRAHQSLGEEAPSTSANSVPSLQLLDVAQAKAEEHFARALRLQLQDDDRGVEREFRAAWNEVPKKAKFVRGIANFYIQKGLYDKAIEIIREHVKLSGETALGWELEGELLFHQKHFDAADQALSRSVSLSDHNPRPHQLLGLIYALKRQNREALRELRIAAEEGPDQPQFRYSLGRVYYSTANYPAARDEFLACLKLQPGFPKALENLGLSYEALNEDDKALQAYQEAIALEKQRKGVKRVEALVYSAVLKAKMGNLDEALELLRMGVTLSPKSFRANFELGRLLLKAGQFSSAEKYLLAAAELDSKFSRTYYFLAMLNRERKRVNEVNRYIALFQQLDQDVRNREFPLTDR